MRGVDFTHFNTCCTFNQASNNLFFFSKFKRLHIFVVPLYIVLWHLEVVKKTCVDVFIFNMFNKNKTEAEQFSNTIMNIDINMEKSTFYV